MRAKRDNGRGARRKCKRMSEWREGRTIWPLHRDGIHKCLLQTSEGVVGDGE